MPSDADPFDLERHLASHDPVFEQPDVVFASRVRTCHHHRARGDEVSAARVSVWLAWDRDAFRGEYAIT